MNVDGEIYFVTSNTINDQRIFTNNEYCQILLKNIDFYRRKLKFRLYAYCIIPWHVHLLILPRRGKNISKIMQLIKYRTARDIRKYNHDLRSRQPGCRLPGAWLEGQRCLNSIWQRSFHDRIVRSDRELDNKIDYINYNAVKHRIVDDPITWPYSSFHNHYKTEKELIEIDYI